MSVPKEAGIGILAIGRGGYSRPDANLGKARCLHDHGRALSWALMEAPRRPTPARIRLIGRMLNRLVVRAPWTWPAIRSPMRRFFDRSAVGWDDRTGAGSVEHLAPLAAALLHVRPAPERALEVGTGTGEGALLIAREFPQASVRGVDISEEMIRVAAAKVGLDPQGRVAFRVADAADLPYDDESFDLIAHLNMPPFIVEVARILRPGGTVIVASSWGTATPFYTPRSVLDWGFAKRGIEPMAVGDAAGGTYWVGRKTPRPG